MRNFYFLALLSASIAPLVHSGECGRWHDLYAEKNGTILVRDSQDTKRVSPGLISSVRPELQTIMENAIRSTLQADHPLSAVQIRAEIQCIQGRARAEEENPELPYVISIPGTREPQFLIAYVINAGGIGTVTNIVSPVRSSQ